MNIANDRTNDNSTSKIYNLIILDESGSMSHIRREALSGVNETLQTIRRAQKENPSDNQMVTFVTFTSRQRGSGVRTLIRNERIENVNDIAEDQYNPGGCTPLYDAMGISITELKEVAKDGDNVIVTVITDGYENSSCQYSGLMIKELVDFLSAQGWAFTYIGANQDSITEAGRLGIRSTMDFEASSAGSSMMWEKMNSGNKEFYRKVRERREHGTEFDYNEDFYGEKQSEQRVTPYHVTTLGPDEIFVFGSNPDGHHDGGTARLALERFGAIYGLGFGLQGNSFAIPTMGLSLREIKNYVDEFINFAEARPEMKFLVTRIGCGHAGFTDEEIAPMFAGAYGLSNVYLPAEFWKFLTYRYRR